MQSTAGTTLDPAPPGESAAPQRESASAAARRNFSQNLHALSVTQPDLPALLGPPSQSVRWLFARDGSLTALDAHGKWWRGCSVPRLAGRKMLQAPDLSGRVACFLCPDHAAAVETALDAAAPGQSIIVLEPDAEHLRVLLHLADFRRPVAAGSLWFAAGPRWESEMRRLFSGQPGLATPSQFIRLPTTPAEQVERLVREAQAVFADVGAARAAEIQSLRTRRRQTDRGRRKVCVISPSRYRLWQDAGARLAEALSRHAEAGDGLSVAAFDPDRPTHSSPLALARAAGACDAVVAADASRADLPDVVPPEIPWLTWVSRAETIPPLGSAGPSDALLLADARLAGVAAGRGWPAERALVAGWPVAESRPSSGGAAGLAVICDTRPVVAPERLSEFSSHRLLWNELGARLAADPLCLRGDPADFLDAQMRRFGVAAEGFDRALFVESLILPAYQQSLARLLLTRGIKLILHGAGWREIEAFRPCAAGPVTSAQHLADIAAGAAALLHLWPGRNVHPIESLGRPVLIPAPGMSADALVAAAKQFLHRPPPLPPFPRFDPAQVLVLLRRFVPQP